jgi:hypothetical protein
MTGSNLISVLRPLCECDPPEISWQAIAESELRGEFETLVNMGALLQADNNDSILCLACDQPHTIDIEYTGNGTYRAYCPDSGFQDVPPELLRRFAVSIVWIGQSLASSVALPFRSDPHMPANAPITRIGRTRFGPYPCELFIACRLADKVRFDDAMRQVSARSGNTPAIVLTTTQLDLVPGEPPACCALLQLDEVLQLCSGKLCLDDGPIWAALRGQQHPVRSGGIGFDFSPGFRSARFGNTSYQFSDKQALAVEAMYEAWRRGLTLHQTEIQGAADTPQRVGQLFAGHAAYGVLIKSPGEGFYTLDL